MRLWQLQSVLILLYWPQRWTILCSICSFWHHNWQYRPHRINNTADNYQRKCKFDLWIRWEQSSKQKEDIYQGSMSDKWTIIDRSSISPSGSRNDCWIRKKCYVDPVDIDTILFEHESICASQQRSEKLWKWVIIAWILRTTLYSLITVDLQMFFHRRHQAPNESETLGKKRGRDMRRGGRAHQITRKDTHQTKELCAKKELADTRKGLSTRTEAG